MASGEKAVSRQLVVIGHKDVCHTPGKRNGGVREGAGLVRRGGVLVYYIYRHRIF